MATRIRVWEVSGGKIVDSKSASFADSHREDELENWIVQSPEILGEKLLIIARQLVIPEVGRLDLLAIDAEGRLVIVELKRDLGPREAVAQALDYASWIDSVPEEYILERANEYLQNKSGDSERGLSEAFGELFGRSVPELVSENHRILIVAAGLDASAERIVNYLSQKSININAVFFNYCELQDGKQLLVRSVLVPESAVVAKGVRQHAYSEAILLGFAGERSTTDILEVCRRMKEVWREYPEDTAQGSFRYWAGDRMVYGVNTSGKLANPPLGQLDIWIRTDKLAGVTGIEEGVIKQRLQRFSPFNAGKMNFVIRLSDVQQAETLVAELRQLVTEQLKKSAVAGS